MCPAVGDSPFVLRVWDQRGDPRLLEMMDERLGAKKKKPIRNCQRGGNTSHHITSQRRCCFNFTFSNATYLHPSCLKRPLLNFTALLCQFANWSKTTADVNLILGGSDDGVSGMEFIFLNGVCSLRGLNKEYSSQNSAYERNNTR